MAQLKYLENGVWVAADTIPQSSDTNPGLIRVYNGLDQVETGFALDASQGKILQDQIDILSNLANFEDITSQCVLQNSWSIYQRSLSVYIFGNVLFISGLLYAGTIGTNVKILKLPTEVSSRIYTDYNYIYASKLGNNAPSWCPIRAGYLQQDNNAAISASTGNLVSFMGFIPLKPIL